MSEAKKELIVFDSDAKFTCAPERKVAYFVIMKAGCGSFRNTFLKNEKSREEYNAEIKKVVKEHRLYFIFGRAPKQQLNVLEKEIVIKYLTKIKMMKCKKSGGWLIHGYDNEAQYSEKPISSSEINEYFIFTFVRNPFTRLVSCFQDKYEHQLEKKFLNREGFAPKEVEGFADFAVKTSKINDKIANGHFKSQWFIIEILRAFGIEINFTGKLENVEADFAPIREKYDLLPLEIRNSSKNNAQHENWQDYYTPEIARIVYARYKKDFENLGYADEYPKLLDYIKKNHYNK